jgi:hypothetical protein
MSKLPLRVAIMGAVREAIVETWAACQKGTIRERIYWQLLRITDKVYLAL